MAKCRICKNNIKPSIDDFIKLNKTFYYHTECYKNKELDKLTPLEVVEDVIKKAKEDFEIEQKNKTKVYKGKSVKTGLDTLVVWIQQEYSISFLPKIFYSKMATVANGSYKGLKEPVPYTDLLDMLQRQKPKLDRQLASKKFDQQLYRFYYDLAVVLNKYDSYKAWKINQENNREKIINDIDFQKRVNETEKIQSIKHDESSIEGILDDIFD